MKPHKEQVILEFIDFNDEKVEKTIYLTSKASNLGKGLVWFFICPYTDATCRNFIFINNRFMHRSNVMNAMNGTQVESKYWRKLFQLQPNISKTQKVLDKSYTKHYKKFLDFYSFKNIFIIKDFKILILIF